MNMATSAERSGSLTNNSNTGAIEVIEAGTGDLDQLAPLFDAYRQFYEQPSDLPGAEVFLAERLKRHESAIFLAQISQGETRTAIGFTQLYPSFSSISMQPLWILNDLFVAPESRQLGVGRALLEEARNFAARTGATSMVLQTAVTNTVAQALYESLGWERDELYYTYELAI